MPLCRTLSTFALRRAAPIALTLVLPLVQGCSRQPEWRGTPVSPARVISPTEFSDSAGAVVQLVPPTGAAALVFFGYTNCPDICPTTLADWARVKKAMGDNANRVRFVFITIDPARDTPAVAQRYAAQFDPAFVGVSASAEKTAAVQTAFGASSAQPEAHSTMDHMMGHSVETFLVDDRGNILVSYRFGAGWDVMSADIKTLLKL